MGFFGNYDSYFIFITISWLNKSNYVYVNVTLTWNETPIVCFYIIKTRKPPTFYILKKPFHVGCTVNDGKNIFEKTNKRKNIELHLK